MKKIHVKLLCICICFVLSNCGQSVGNTEQQGVKVISRETMPINSGLVESVSAKNNSEDTETNVKLLPKPVYGGFINALPASPQQIPSLIAGTAYESLVQRQAQTEKNEELNPNLTGSLLADAIKTELKSTTQVEQINPALLGTPFETAIRQAIAFKNQQLQQQ